MTSGSFQRNQANTARKTKAKQAYDPTDVGNRPHSSANCTSFHSGFKAPVSLVILLGFHPSSRASTN
jgi:hypothetical protein